MLIKICGITNLEDALVAIEAGAGALGFNFWPRSHRYIDPRSARLIIEQLPPEVLTAGVFVNEASPQIVAEIADEARVAALQLHGDESPEYCEALAQRRIIKALPVDHEFEPRSALAYQVEAIMLDGADRTARGGTGKTFDWSIARRTRELGCKIILAGGLSPENVAEAIAAVGPFGIDACSSLEIEPGKKDHERVRAFIQAARVAVAARHAPPDPEGI